MNLDEIEDLIRRYLSAGITVVIILVVPATDGADGEVPPGGDPSVVTIEPPSPDADDSPPEEDDEIDMLDPTDGVDLDPRRPADDDGSDDLSPDDPDTDDPDTDAPGTDDPDPKDHTDPTAGEPGDDRAEEPGDDHADDPAGRPTDDHADDPASQPAEDRDDSEDGEPHDPHTADEPSSDDADVPSADDSETDEDRSDESSSDDTEAPDPPDRESDDPDLEDRGPADGSEPGIDDEHTEPEDTSTGRDPADDDTATEDTATEGTTAAERYDWGTPDQEDDFSSGLAQWDLYDGPGHAGEGMRSPDAVTVQDGVLTITGDGEGTTGGMTWTPGQRYGRWEGRVRAPASDPSYNALLLLWPDAEDFPEGGEIDFMEMLDPTRQSTEFFLHHGPDNEQVTAQVEIDGTEWHNWAVEWTPEEIVGYVDGEEWFRTTDTSTFPPGPMHLCIQLDWFPDGAGEVQESTMEVDWVRQYTLDPADREPADDQRDDDVASTEPAAVAGTADPEDDPLRRMFSWS